MAHTDRSAAPRRWPFVVVEGPDGAGKTTLRKGLFRLLESLYSVAPLALLTTNYLADVDVALDLVDGKYAPTAENRGRYLAALAADKRATVERLVLPALPARPVVADRWLISEMAFFAIRHARPLKETYEALTADLAVVPDVTLVLDVAPRAAMARAADRSGDATRPDWDTLQVQSPLRDIYTEVTATSGAYPALGPVVRIDASLDRGEVLRAAWRALDDHQLLPMLGADGGVVR